MIQLLELLLRSLYRGINVGDGMTPSMLARFFVLLKRGHEIFKSLIKFQKNNAQCVPIDTKLYAGINHHLMMQIHLCFGIQNTGSIKLLNQCIVEFDGLQHTIRLRIGNQYELPQFIIFNCTNSSRAAIVDLERILGHWKVKHQWRSDIALFQYASYPLANAAPKNLDFRSQASDHSVKVSPLFILFTDKSLSMLIIRNPYCSQYCSYGTDGLHPSSGLTGTVAMALKCNNQATNEKNHKYPCNYSSNPFSNFFLHTRSPDYFEWIVA